MKEALQNIVEIDPKMGRMSIHVAELMENTQYISFGKKEDIQWNLVKYLYIVSYQEHRDNLASDQEIPQGIYVSNDKSWVLIQTKMFSGFSHVIPRCAESLISLVVQCDITEDIDVSLCSKLQTLYAFNKSFDDNVPYVRGVQGLRYLKKLRLNELQFECELDVSQIPDLQILGLTNYLPKVKLSVKGVPVAKKLVSLHLSQISWGGELDVSALTELEQLVLYDGKHEDDHLDNHLDWVTGVSFLTKLEHLELCCGLLETSIDVSRHDKLKYLILYYNKKLKSITGLERLQNLEYLNLNATGIQTVPAEVRGLTKLKNLSLEKLDLEKIPDWLPELNLPFTRKQYENGISLHGTTVQGVDMSIFDQPREVILQWFEEQKLGNARPLNEVKVVFLGDGEAGKTHTITRLLKDGEKPEEKDFDGKATPGIVIKNKDYTLDGQKIQVHFWDFGGQEILHSMHRMFLTERTLYVVIINARDDTQDDRARYWLHNIKSFAGTAPVLLVLNKVDQNPNASIDLPGLQKMYSGLKQVVRMSALEYTKEKFNKVFTAALMDQVKALGTHGVLWPNSWLKLKKGLEKMPTHYIHGNDYENLCEESGVEQSREELLHWFNDLGVSFCYSGSAKLEDYVILKPEWLTNAIYIILFNECKEVKNGIIPRSAIDRMLKKPRKGQKEIRRVLADVFYNPQEVDYVMDVIRKFRLSYKVREDAEFIPVLCQRESMAIAEEYAADPNALEFTMDYEYLPDNVIHRLMVEMRQDLDTTNVWRTGARFAQAGTSFSAVVKSEGNLLRIFVRSDDPMHRPNTYLHIIKGNIDRINADMKLQPPFCEVIYKADGIEEAFDYEDLLYALRDGEETYRSKDRRRRIRNIPIYDILNQSGRTAEMELDNLRKDIITACMQIQGDRLYWNASEDDRNTAIRNALRNKHYIVNDQSFQGVSGEAEKKAGELDLEIRKKTDIPWTVCEALIVEGRENSIWEPHLDKLLDNYNPSGLNYLFLLTYVDCDKDRFPKIWNHFREHIRWFNPGGGKYERLPSSFSDIPLPEHGDPNYIRAARITYDREGSPTTVCHIFARIGR